MTPRCCLSRKGQTPPGIERQGVKLHQAIGGLPIIRMMIETAPTDFYKALWGPCITSSQWIGSIGYEKTLDNLLELFERTGFGDATVGTDGAPHALITLNEVASLYRERKLECDLRVDDVASPPISVDPETTLIDAMKLMCEKRVRRVFMHGKEGEFVSDRGILAFLFSPQALKVARDTPESWIDQELSAIKPMKAHFVSPHAHIEDVGRMIEAGRDTFMLSGEGSLVARWDLLIRPWKADELRLAL